MQFQADILAVPVDRPALVETTAAGAAPRRSRVGLGRTPRSSRRGGGATGSPPSMPMEKREALTRVEGSGRPGAERAGPIRPERLGKPGDGGSLGARRDRSASG